MKQTLLFVRKTARDDTRPLLLLAFLVPYLGLAVLISLLLTTGQDPLSAQPIAAQEQALLNDYSRMAFVWLVTFPMVFIAVVTARSVAGEHERGTLRVLLSKPVRRSEVLLGQYLAITAVGWLVMLVGLFVGAVALVLFAEPSDSAIQGGLLAFVPATAVYALVVAAVTAAVGTLIGVLTRSRLKTVILTSLLPVTFLGFVFAKFLLSDDLYEQYFLYLPDVNYHLGVLFAVVHDLLGGGFDPSTAERLDTVSGAFDGGGAWEDPLLEGFVGSIPLAGHVPTVVSVVGLLALGVASLGLALWRFERMDVG